MLQRIKEHIKMVKEILQLPQVTLSLNGNEELYRSFTARHPRYKFLKWKTIGVCLLPLDTTAEAYLDTIRGKNSATYHARRGEKKGYTFAEIDPNEYLEDIYAINTSKPIRQGEPMKAEYTKKIDHFQIRPNYRYYGVLSSEGQLAAYTWVIDYPEVIIISALLGHAEHLNAGIMFLMVTKLACSVMSTSAEQRPRFLMYDMFFGATDGLKLFKKKIGFKPYRVRWTL